MKLRICDRCGWAHMPCSRTSIEDQARRFGEYITKEPAETQKLFGLGPLSASQQPWGFEAHVAQSEHCFRCGNMHTAFHDVTPEEEARIPIGCTLQGIIDDRL